MSAIPRRWTARCLVRGAIVQSGQDLRSSFSSLTNEKLIFTSAIWLLDSSMHLEHLFLLYHYHICTNTRLSSLCGAQILCMKDKDGRAPRLVL